MVPSVQRGTCAALIIKIFGDEKVKRTFLSRTWPISNEEEAYKGMVNCASAIEYGICLV
jgi:hypothetical protein